VATALDLPVLVSLPTADIDLVAAMLLGPRVVMLCDASELELVAALAVAGATNGGASMLHGHVHEGESERLRQLNAEVARIAEVLARLSVQARREGAAGSATGIRVSTPPPRAPSRAMPRSSARSIRARRLRDGLFGEGLFEEPAWDMLLDLYAAHLEAPRIGVQPVHRRCRRADHRAALDRQDDRGRAVRAPARSRRSPPRLHGADRPRAGGDARLSGGAAAAGLTSLPAPSGSRRPAAACPPDGGTHRDRAVQAMQPRRPVEAAARFPPGSASC
jgi:hypothetical protein